MAKMNATFERVPGSVFVRVPTPNEVAPVPSIERQYSDWSEVAAEMADDVPVDETPEPEPVSPSPIEEVRVYAVNPLTAKRKRIYTGERTDDIRERCRAYADTSKHRVELHDATDSEVFHPVCPATPTDAPPISDEMKPPSIQIFNADTGEIIEAGENMPADFDSRAQRYADDNNVTLRVATDSGMRSRFYIPKNEKARMARENAKKWAERVGDVVGLAAIISVSWLSYIVMGVA